MTTNFTEVIISGSKPAQIPFGHIPVSDGSGSFTHEAGTIFIASSSNEYIVVSGANKSGIPNARDLVHGNGLQTADSGPGNSLTVSVDDSQVPFLSGATFDGPVTGTFKFQPGSQGEITGTITSASYVAGIESQFLIISGSPFNGLVNARYLHFGSAFSTNDQGVTSSFEVNADDSVIAHLSGSDFVGPVSASICLKSGSTGELTGSITELENGSPFITSDGTITTETGSGGGITLKQASPYFIPFFNGVVTRSEGDTSPTTMGGNHIDTTEYAGFLTATLQVLMSVPTASLSGVFQLFDLFESASVVTLTGSSETINDYILYESSGSLFTGSRSYKLEAYTNPNDGAIGEIEIIMARVKLTS